MPATLNFDATASRPKHAVALIYDLDGFSRFFNQPDVQDYVPQFINTVDRAMSVMILGGKQFWGTKDEHAALTPEPVHVKFLGDGALYVWVGTAQQAITTGFVTALCNRLWNLQSNFTEVVETAYDKVPVVDVPKRIRFGIARGTVYELRRKGSRGREYIGFCINLASRLQKYCPELGFIASARIGLSEKTLANNRYIRVIAKAIRGFSQEIVVVDRDEYGALSEETRERYFAPL